MSLQNENVESKEVTLSTSIAPFDTNASNAALEWRTWSKRFKIYLVASGLDAQPDKRKVALLLHQMGPSTMDIFNSFNMEIDEVKYTDLFKKFEEYFIPKVNIAMERHAFFTRCQKTEESIVQYATAMENLSISCEFGTLRESLLKDIFTCGLSEKYKNIKERLLSEGNITWKKALEISKSMEMAKVHVATIQNGGQSGEHYEQIAALQSFKKKNQQFQQQYNNQQKQQWQQQSSKQPSSSECRQCGQKHSNRCPAEGAKCNACGKWNHYAKMCFSKMYGRRQNNRKFVKNVDAEEEEDGEEEDDDNLFVGVVGEASRKTSIWNVTVEVEGREMICQVDTGAQVNLMSISTFEKLKLSINKVDNNVSSKIVTFSGEKLPVMGKIFINLLYEKKAYPTYFYILNMDCNNIIGLELASKMHLIKSVNSINCNEILEEYKDMFHGLGQLKDKCHLQIKENSQPVIDPPRRVPFSLHESLKSEIERMVKLNVIVEVREPTDWVNSLVLVTKSNGNLRVCLDPRNLNKVIVRPRYDFPTIDECKSQMSGSSFFSLLDANSGFWMVRLDDESSRLCTFNTPFGRYRFLRLPFGISSAPEIFHAEMIKLFSDIEGLVIYMDDFLIHAPNVEKHNEILRKVLERGRRVGIKFNRSKSVILKSEIKFIGHIFSGKGVKPDVKRVESILAMPVPTNKQELQRFLGMINYLGSFIDNLSNKNKHLRDLLKNDSVWSWNHEQQLEFENLKIEITKAPVLTYYDTKKPLVLSVDASKFAVGAVIMHGENPIAYASASLTECQMNYAQIEKELFAILFGCTRFHQYIYGRNVTVETDHKPLVPLFKKPLHNIPTRLQRFMLRLLSYNITVVYKPGKDLFIADTLSRAPLKEKVFSDLDKDIDLQCNAVINQTELPSDEIEQIKKEVEKDQVLRKICNYLKQGWPDCKKQMDPDVQPFYSIKDEIHQINGILFKNKRIIIPRSLRSKMLKYVHEGHMGIQGCQNLARGSIYWPNINSDIYNVVSSCETCLKYRNSNPKEDLKNHDIVNIPWYKAKSVLARTPARKNDALFSPVSYSPIGTPRTHNAAPGSGKIVYTFGNSTLISNAQWSFTAQPKICVRQLLLHNGECLGPGTKAKYMFDNLREKTEIARERIFNIGKGICLKVFGEDAADYDLSHVDVHSQDTIKTVGTIFSDCDGKLDASSTILLGSDEMACHTVRLNFSKAKSVGVFPGQIVMLSGVNPKGDVFIVEELITEQNLKPPTPPCNADRLSFVIAAGPYTQDDDLVYDPLQDLVSYLKESRPNVLILCGPFMEADHKLISDNVTLAEPFEVFFEKMIAGVAEAVGVETTILVVASHLDANGDCVYPTMAIQLKKTYPNVYMLPDPSMVDLNGIIIGMTSTDIVDHLLTEELSVNAGDKVKRVVNYLLHQKSFYPLNPPKEDVMCFDSDLASKYANIEQIPNILILPSTQKCFLRVVNGCLAINPGRLADNNGGTFARFIINPPSPKEESNLFNYVGCQVRKV